MEQIQQIYNYCRVSDQSDKPDVSGHCAVPARRLFPRLSSHSPNSVRTAPLAVALMLASLAVGTPAFADDIRDESSRSTAAQVWGYAQGITKNLSRGVAGWFGRGEEVVEVRHTETRRAEPDTTSVTLSPDLMLEAFPVLSQGGSEDTLRALDGSQEVGGPEFGFGIGRATRESDLNASYIWESARFGQFILSTSTGYQPRGMDRLLEGSQAQSRGSEPGASAFGAGTVTGVVPELQSSFTFTWQIGNHTATAVTTYADTLDSFNGLSTAQINVEQLNELVGQMGALDLRYGYSVRTGRQSSASISVGVRNMFDRRGLLPGTTGVSSRLTEPSRVAYGSIKYQF